MHNGYTVISLLTWVCRSSSAIFSFSATALSRSSYHLVTTSNNRVENNTVASKNLNRNATRTTSTQYWLNQVTRDVTEFNSSQTIPAVGGSSLCNNPVKQIPQHYMIIYRGGAWRYTVISRLTWVSRSSFSFLATALSRSSYHIVTTSNNRVENNTVTSIRMRLELQVHNTDWVRLRNRYKRCNRIQQLSIVSSRGTGHQPS